MKATISRIPVSPGRSTDSGSIDRTDIVESLEEPLLGDTSLPPIRCGGIAGSTQDDNRAAQSAVSHFLANNSGKNQASQAEGFNFPHDETSISDASHGGQNRGSTPRGNTAAGSKGW